MHPLLCIICQKLPLTCKRGCEAIHMGRNLFHLYAFVKLFSHQTRILHIYPQPALAVDIWLAARCNQGEATGELPATSATLVGQPSVGFVRFFHVPPTPSGFEPHLSGNWATPYFLMDSGLGDGYTFKRFVGDVWRRWCSFLLWGCWVRYTALSRLAFHFWKHLKSRG